jgi:hypothetical protein
VRPGAGFALPRFCMGCGEWFDGAASVRHCGDRSTDAAWPLMSPTPSPVETRVKELFRAPPAPASVTYGETLPTAPGRYVYRLWDTPGGCLYVGMIGDSGPRRLSARLGEHRRTKGWWPQVARIDAAECDLFQLHDEEMRQIRRLGPAHNVLIGRLSSPERVERWARRHDRR